MSRHHKYTVLIRFSRKGSNKQLKNIDIDYPFSNNTAYKDNLIIQEKSIKLVSNRSKKNDLKNLFYDGNMTIVSQVTKALVYYYCAIGENNEISSITISRYFKELLEEKEVIKKTQISQIVTKTSDLSLFKNINKVELETIFQEDEKGHALMFALTHLIQSFTSIKVFDKFEKSWKAFNSIYKIKEGDSRDFECLRKLRTHMISNISNYPLSTNFVSNFSQDDIFNNISWRKMILNDFPTEANMDYFKGFIERTSDIRLINIINETLTIKQTHLTNRGHYNYVISHITSTISANNRSDIEVVAFLCLRYMYYLRNKLMHAERTDPNFHLLKDNSNEELKIKWCNNVLIRLIIDLINFNSRF